MTTNIGEDVETEEHRLVGVKSNTTIIEIILNVLQNIFFKKITLRYEPAIPLLGVHSKNKALLSTPDIIAEPCLLPFYSQ